jgi:hypothetical protein
VQKEKIKENNEKIIQYSKSNFSMMILLFTLSILAFNLNKLIEKVNENKTLGGSQRSK